MLQDVTALKSLDRKFASKGECISNGIQWTEITAMQAVRKSTISELDSPAPPDMDGDSCAKSVKYKFVTCKWGQMLFSTRL